MHKHLISILFSLCLCPQAFAQSHAQNYIRTITPREAYRNITKLPDYAGIATIQYFDGLGRPVQTVRQGETWGFADLVSQVEYDAAGRVSKEWLPVPCNGVSGIYHTPEDFSNKSASFYGDGKAYTQTYYDTSPLNKVLKKMGPGAEWHTNDRSTTVQYSASSGALEVPHYTVEGDKLRKKGDYYPNALRATVTKDEDNVPCYEHTDVEGRRVKYKNVHHVYDNMGHLRFVLPPRTSITEDGLYAVTPESGLYRYAYAYTYDKRGNCISKKLPGIEPIYYVYDPADQLILSQSPNQRARNEWSFIKYDCFSRPVLSGTTVINGKTHAQSV